MLLVVEPVEGDDLFYNNLCYTNLFSNDRADDFGRIMVRRHHGRPSCSAGVGMLYEARA